jgi:branched-chain amino acid transport system substrate-binding protein
MVAVSGAQELTQRQRSKYIFRSSFTSGDASHPLGDWAYKNGYRKAVILATDIVGGHEVLGPFARTFTKLGGHVIQEIYFPGGTPDFAPYLLKINRDADVVVAVLFGGDAIRFVNQYAEFGLKGKIPLISRGFLTDESLLPKMGKNAEGVVTAHQWSAALDTPANKSFRDAYVTKYKRPANAFAESAYVAAKMIAQALDSVKGNVEDKEAFLAALGKAEVDAPRGKVRLDAFHNVVHPIYIRRVQQVGGSLQNVVIDIYPNTGQFWDWAPEQYMALPLYPEMKGKWAK